MSSKSNAACLTCNFSSRWHGQCSGLSQDLAEAPTSESATSEGIPWSGIVFAKRKLAVVALHRLVATLPRLSFLRSRAIMGHGGRLAATSLTTKASAWPEPWMLRFLQRAAQALADHMLCWLASAGDEVTYLSTCHSATAYRCCSLAQHVFDTGHRVC